MVAGVTARADEDPRAWQHGIDLVRIGDRWLMVWGSAGDPPQPNPGGDWQHDIYYAWLNNAAPWNDAAIEPHILVSLPEAQEPPSTALNRNGTVLITSEDGSSGIHQQAGLWDSQLRVLRRYPFRIKRGGHSGHVAALGERFLVAYGEGWVDGGGFLDRGTGKNIYARIVENDGTRRKETLIATGHRDSWPLVAASDRNWLVVWQRYPELTLQSALINAAGKVVKRNRIIDGLALRYAYDVEFAPQLAAYVVAGATAADGGFITLVNLAGDVLNTQRGLPPMASESRILLGWDGAQWLGVYPVWPRGVAVVRLTPDTIELVKLIDHPYVWDSAGTTGTFVAPDRVVFATLSATGLHLIPVNLRD